jgi:hypothetical protein
MQVKSMPDFYYEMSNDTIVTLASLGDQVVRTIPEHAANISHMI